MQNSLNYDLMIELDPNFPTHEMSFKFDLIRHFHVESKFKVSFTQSGCIALEKAYC